jgi:hypothetical protein
VNSTSQAGSGAVMMTSQTSSAAGGILLLQPSNPPTPTLQTRPRCWGRPDANDQVVIVASWTYTGSGYATEGERWLALSAAARAREQRRVAWEELRTIAA